MQTRRCNKNKYYKDVSLSFHHKFHCSDICKLNMSSLMQKCIRKRKNGVSSPEKKQLEKQVWCRSITWKIKTANIAKIQYPDIPT